MRIADRVRAVRREVIQVDFVRLPAGQIEQEQQDEKRVFGPTANTKIKWEDCREHRHLFNLKP